MHVSLVNHIPIQILSKHDFHRTDNPILIFSTVGPAAPISQSSVYPQRYSKDMFSKARPQYITPPTIETLQDITTVSSRQLKAVATAPLKPISQGRGFAIGYFEQGLISGASIVISIVLPAVGYGTYLVGRKVFQHAVRR